MFGERRKSQASATCSGGAPSREATAESARDCNGVKFERNGAVVEVTPKGPLVSGFGGATDLAVEAAVAGCGVIYLYEEWLRPFLDGGALAPVLQPWWLSFSGPFLYYPGRRYLPTPLRAFLDFLRTTTPRQRGRTPR